MGRRSANELGKLTLFRATERAELTFNPKGSVARLVAGNAERGRTHRA
jgi:hypothetical protein